MNALFRAAAGGCTGHGGTSSEVFRLVEATVEHSRRATALAAAEAVATPRSPGGEVEDVTDAAARTRLSSSASHASCAPRPAPRLPPPALSPQLAYLAAQLAARVDDITPASDSSLPIGLARRAAAPPKVTYALTPNTKLVFVPTAHAHAFELSDAKSFLAGGTTRLLLRAAHEGDATEWALAINTLVETGVAL